MELLSAIQAVSFYIALNKQKKKKEFCSACHCLPILITSNINDDYKEEKKTYEFESVLVYMSPVCTYGSLVNHQNETANMPQCTPKGFQYNE